MNDVAFCAGCCHAPHVGEICEVLLELVLGENGNETRYHCVCGVILEGEEQ